MITLHHLNNSRAQRVLWLLEELGVPYEIARYERQANMLAPPSLRAVHPLGKSPIISDDGRVIAESGAILEYLADRYGQGRFSPARGSDEQLRCTYWLHYGEGSLMPLLVMKLVFGQIAKGPMPFLARPVARGIVDKVESTFLGPELARHFAYIEGELAKSTWFAGEELTIADVQMSFPIEAAASRSADTIGDFPRLRAFLERVHARPAYQRALAKGGAFKVL